MTPTDTLARPYWLCCGSFEPSAPRKTCVEAKIGHPERCRFGTADQHSEWQIANVAARADTPDRVAQIVDQTITGIGNPRGNCLQAALATITGLPLASVIDVTEPHIGGDWHDHMVAWGELRGFKIWSTTQKPVVGYFIACGPTEKREGKHAIVCLDGYVYHDPHPSRDGITEAHYYILADAIEAGEPFKETPDVE